MRLCLSIERASFGTNFLHGPKSMLRPSLVLLWPGVAQSCSSLLHQCFCVFFQGTLPSGPLTYTHPLTREQSIFIFNALRSLHHASDFLWAVHMHYQFCMQQNSSSMAVQSPILPHNFVTPIQLQVLLNEPTHFFRWLSNVIAFLVR